jgi:hypothetical protein
MQVQPSSKPIVHRRKIDFVVALNAVALPFVVLATLFAGPLW